MCSIGEDDFGDDGGLHAMLKDEESFNKNTIMGICAKCEADGAVIKLKFREPECHQCFLAYTRHKFRATLGSSKILPKGAEVLLIFNGSAESMVLLDMMQYAKTQSTHKRLHVNTKVLFIDESAINDDIEVTNALQILSRFDFESYIISLTSSTLYNIKDINCYLEYKDDQFSKSFQDIKPLTSRQDFLKIWKNGVIQQGATQLNCNYIFSPDISTSLATDLLTSIALGRGGSVALDVSLLDDRLSDIKIIRPLRNLTGEEITFYLDVQNLKPAKGGDSFGIHFGSSCSIQNLTRRFVEDLQSNFSSTISTVFRTGDKIAPLTTKADVRIKCSFCNSEMDSETSKTLQAVEFSSIACGPNVFTSNSNETPTMGLSPENLCHACQNIQKDCENIDLSTKKIKQ